MMLLYVNLVKLDIDYKLITLEKLDAKLVMPIAYNAHLIESNALCANGTTTLTQMEDAA